MFNGTMGSIAIRHGRPAPILSRLAFAALLAAGCGGDDCAGFLSVNVSPAECERLAAKFGCTSFDVDGPSCGLSGCATCNGDRQVD